MIIYAYFASGGAPATGLTPIINVRNTAGTLVVYGVTMSEVGDGFYTYDFAAADPDVNYTILCDGGESLSNTERYAVATTGSSGEIADIKERTDNLPDDPASQAGVTGVASAVAASETVVTNAVASSESTVTSAISASETNIRGGSDTLGVLSNQLDGNLSAIQSIQNNTTRRIDIPTRLIRPDAGSKTYRLILGIYDSTGMPEVPDSVPTVQIENIAGVEWLAETVITQYTDQDGQYYYDLVVSASDALEILIVTIKVVEGGVTSYHRRATEVTEFESDLNEVQANVVAIKTKTDYLPANTAQELTDIDGAVAAAQSSLDDGGSGLAAIKAAVDTVDTVADEIKERTDRLPDAPASEGNVNSVRAKTDYLPADTAQELTDIDSAIANSESNITSLLNDASSGLAALKALIDNVDTSAELAARFTEIKGTGWASETLVQLDGLLDAIKAKTDQLPTDTAQELADIDAEIAGVRTKTDNLPTDTSLELDAIDTEIAATRERTNRLPDDPADQSLVHDALDAAESRINTDLDELIARDTGQSVELASIHSDLLLIKERTDYLPANLVSSIDQINIKLSQLSSGDGGVSADEIQTMLNALGEDLTDLLNVMQSDVTFIRDIEGGRWRIVGTQMVFFKEDNATEIARFNLYNASGTESATSVYERRRA